MSSKLKIERIKCALQKYQWNRADNFKPNEDEESYGPLGMLLRDAGVPAEEFSKELSWVNIYSLVRKHHKFLLSEYGLKYATDLQLIITASDCSSSAQDMVWRVVEALSGNVSVFPPMFRKWIYSLVERREEIGYLSDAIENGGSGSMTPCLRNRKLAEVQVGKTWNMMLAHRVYSCPDTSEYDFVSDASCLLLKCRQTGRRVFLNVKEICTLNPSIPNFTATVPERFRERLNAYKASAQCIPGILDGAERQRFYFLSTEPWTVRMQELTASTSPTEWSAIISIFTASEDFFRWPQVGQLFWPWCTRKENDGEHIYPPNLIDRLSRLGLKPDTRTNGPAILSFWAAGGKRPSCGSEGWHIHHIFDGTEGSRHAVRDGNLFTHSAGLVAAHPVAHHLAHQSLLLKWLLRREAFLRFGFDPNGDFVAV